MDERKKSTSLSQSDKFCSNAADDLGLNKCNCVSMKSAQLFEPRHEKFEKYGLLILCENIPIILNSFIIKPYYPQLINFRKI